MVLLSPLSLTVYLYLRLRRWSALSPSLLISHERQTREKRGVLLSMYFSIMKWLEKILLFLDSLSILLPCVQVCNVHETRTIESKRKKWVLISYHTIQKWFNSYVHCDTFLKLPYKKGKRIYNAFLKAS